jgi:hypothetical protein
MGTGTGALGEAGRCEVLQGVWVAGRTRLVTQRAKLVSGLLRESSGGGVRIWASIRWHASQVWDRHPVQDLVAPARQPQRQRAALVLQLLRREVPSGYILAV